MKRTEIKEEARKELMMAAQVAFYAVQDYRSGGYIADIDERKVLMAEMDEQFKRIEKLFGYVPGSWARGI